ncbi:hypothetical protein [Tsukamurella paurometabola]|uniref:Uncharacterized protein n=1 Tax=Tsukamurella paurometabola TaxID=2061 RepID=A0A3P8L3P4_TSUPA|nr:hypothetical protein [Tsukamurella paurometabola]UEA84377.1 hypothetical protein LK411_06015 [Tsukamurella paurometabola]VDR36941.1 Uncharacterised protein [Tsukamurella paurometabola]
MSDLQALALVKSIRFAAVVLGASMIVLGVLIWQPWNGPTEPRVVSVDGGSVGSDVTCVRLRENLTCNWPK